MQTQSPFSPLSALIYHVKVSYLRRATEAKREAVDSKSQPPIWVISHEFEMHFPLPLALNEKDIYAVDEKRRALRTKKKLCTNIPLHTKMSLCLRTRCKV